ncbi:MULTISPECIES: histidine phosphatase family protein [unclassified Thioalkalivibrio]|uniref:histidine phosphatase family protein n=1 Tax=unclassified Thioalkalivibrio TaxID=2621013 RepID=UPI0003743E56|nr:MULTISPECIES: histidine phosphatase family protein [unclassified Thioalkalivibrio]
MNTSVRIGLLRHGETTGAGFRGRGCDDPLTPDGERAMRAAFESSGEWDRVVCSPLQRCRLPAEGFARAAGLPVQCDPRLQELHFGDWEGQTAEALMQTDAEALGRFWEDPFGYPPPNGEDLGSFRDRVLAGWEQSVVAPGGRVLVVTHGGVIRLLRAQLEGWPLEKLLSIEVPLASLHVVEPGQREEMPS